MYSVTGGTYVTNGHFIHPWIMRTKDKTVSDTDSWFHCCSHVLGVFVMKLLVTATVSKVFSFGLDLSCLMLKDGAIVCGA